MLLTCNSKLAFSWSSFLTRTLIPNDSFSTFFDLILNGGLSTFTILFSLNSISFSVASLLNSFKLFIGINIFLSTFASILFIENGVLPILDNFIITSSFVVGLLIALSTISLLTVTLLTPSVIFRLNGWFSSTSIDKSTFIFNSVTFDNLDINSLSIVLLTAPLLFSPILLSKSAIFPFETLFTKSPFSL